jgi:hypothetical protein
MTRTQLESLVWRETHRDYKGKRDDGKRCINHYLPERGTCSIALQDLTLGELLDHLPSKYRAQHGFLLWRVVVGGLESRVLGVFGYALFEECHRLEVRIHHQTGQRVRTLLFAGPRPKVGEILDLDAQSLVTS